MIEQVKEKALEERVPIIKDGGLAFLLDFIKKEGAKDILELGTAVGYSSMQMAMLDEEIHIDTLEKNPDMYDQAVKNIAEMKLGNQITPYLTAIEEWSTDKKYDVIFVDAAKAQYGKYMEQFLPNLKEKGAMVFDNMVFHQLIYDVENIKSRSLRSLVRKINRFRDSIQNDERFDIMFYDHLGDGILVLRRKSI